MYPPRDTIALQPMLLALVRSVPLASSSRKPPWTLGFIVACSSGLGCRRRGSSSQGRLQSYLWEDVRHLSSSFLLFGVLISLCFLFMKKTAMTSSGMAKANASSPSAMGKKSQTSRTRLRASFADTSHHLLSEHKKKIKIKH